MVGDIALLCRALSNIIIFVNHLDDGGRFISLVYRRDARRHCASGWRDSISLRRCIERRHFSRGQRYHAAPPVACGSGDGAQHAFLRGVAFPSAAATLTAAPQHLPGDGCSGGTRQALTGVEGRAYATGARDAARSLVYNGGALNIYAANRRDVNAWRGSVAVA